jgi:hypothetical protein
MRDSFTVYGSTNQTTTVTLDGLVSNSGALDLKFDFAGEWQYGR